MWLKIADQVVFLVWNKSMIKWSYDDEIAQVQWLGENPQHVADVLIQSDLDLAHLLYISEDFYSVRLHPGRDSAIWCCCFSINIDQIAKYHVFSNVFHY